MKTKRSRRFIFFQMALEFGASRFLSTYLLSGIGGGLLGVYAAESAPYASHRSSSIVGASSALYGVMACLVAAYPQATLQLYFVLPVPAWIVLSGLAAYDVYRLARSRSDAGAAAHLGGMGTGLAMYFSMFRRRF
jgi:membrane associated rhomboid family serine protease